MNTESQQARERAEYEQNKRDIRMASLVSMFLLFLAYCFSIAGVIWNKHFFEFIYRQSAESQPTRIFFVEIVIIPFFVIPALWLMRRVSIMNTELKRQMDDAELKKLTLPDNKPNTSLFHEIELTRRLLHRLFRGARDKIHELQARLDDAHEFVARSHEIYEAKLRPATPSEQSGDSPLSNLSRWREEEIEGRVRLYGVKAELTQEQHRQDERTLINWSAFAILILHLVVFFTIIIVLYFLFYASDASTAKKISIPVLNLPVYVLLYSWIGSLLAALWRVRQGAAEYAYHIDIHRNSGAGIHSEYPDSSREISWLLARPVMGVGMGIFAYLVLKLGIFGTSGTDAEPKTEMVFLVTLLAGLYDRPWDALVRWAWSRVTPSAEEALADTSDSASVSRTPGANNIQSTGRRMNPTGVTTVLDQPHQSSSNPEPPRSDPDGS